MDPIYFTSPAAFRDWLAEHNASAGVVWVGFHRKATGRPSLTWQEAVDEALCFGWIDGVRKSVDGERFCQRFTPRKPGSIWSTVNINRVAALRELGRMAPAGLAAFEARREGRSGVYSHEQGEVDLSEPDRATFRSDPAAWAFFEAQPPSYRKAATWWVVEAKKPETRARRLAGLIEHSARRERLPQFSRKKPPA